MGDRYKTTGVINAVIDDLTAINNCLKNSELTSYELEKSINDIDEVIKKLEEVSQ